MSRATFHLRRAEALPDPDHPEGRLCAFCGDVIDPIYYCGDCANPDAACTVHRRPRKRADAAFCNEICRKAHRDTFERDCLPHRQRARSA
jgi:hypothetical protein